MANFEQYSLNLSLIALAVQRLGILFCGRRVVSFVLPSSHATSTTMGYSRDMLEYLPAKKLWSTVAAFTIISALIGVTSIGRLKTCG